MDVSVELAELSRTIDLGVLGARIKTARIAAGLTQTELATPEASTAYLSRIESGDRRPDLKLLVRFAEKANVSLEQLLEGVNQDHRGELRLALDQAQLSLTLGDAKDSLARLSTMRKATTTISANDLVSEARVTEAMALRALGKLDEAVIALEDLIVGGPRVRNWLDASIALTATYLETGENARCIELGEQVLTLLEENGLIEGPHAQSVAASVATAHLDRGDLELAIETCRRTVPEPGPANNSTLATLYRDASSATAATNLALATTFATTARSIADQDQATASLVHFHTTYAELLLREEAPDLEASRRSLELAQTALNATGTNYDSARLQLAFAQVLIAEGDLEGATASLDFTSDAPLVNASRHTLLGQTQQRLRKHKAARDSFSRAAEALAKAPKDRSSAQLWFELGGIFDNLGDKDASGDAYRRAAAATGLAPTTRTQRARART